MHIHVYTSCSIICKTRSSATAEIARVGRRRAVQGHSRSLMLVPIESPIGEYFALFSSYRAVGVSVSVFVLNNLCEYHHKSYTAKN